MAKFIVYVKEIARYRYEIEADSQEAAEEAGIEEHTQTDDINKHFVAVEDRTAWAEQLIPKGPPPYEANLGRDAFPEKGKPT
jgi:hypothetical protein